MRTSPNSRRTRYEAKDQSRRRTTRRARQSNVKHGTTKNIPKKPIYSSMANSFQRCGLAAVYSAPLSQARAEPRNPKSPPESIEVPRAGKVVTLTKTGLRAVATSEWTCTLSEGVQSYARGEVRDPTKSTLARVKSALAPRGARPGARESGTLDHGSLFAPSRSKSPCNNKRGVASPTS